MSRFDVAIVGPGTVGLYLAAALPAGLRVALIGGPLQSADLLGTAPRRSGHEGVLSGWAGGYGGTSTRWGGQLWPWQPWEIAGGRDRAAWPIDHARDIAPYYAAVLRRLGLDVADRTGIHDLSGIQRWPQLHTASTEVRYSTWMDARHRDFRRNPAVQHRSADVRRIEANVDRLEPLGAAHTALLAADGTELARAARVVVTAGTLGSVRLLQRSFPEDRGGRPAGRYFGDHLSGRGAHARVVDRARFEAFAAHRFIRDGRASTRLATTAAHSDGTGALPAYAHFEIASPAVQAVRGLLGTRGAGVPAATGRVLHELPHVPRQLVATAGALRRRRRAIDPVGEVYVRIDVEQPLRRDSALLWDVTGNLEAQWGVGDEERRSAAVALEVFAPLMEEHLGVALEPLGPIALQDIYHLIGGTVMGRRDDPDAVVDEQLGLIDADGIWVAGASVFPSGGMANPTFTALALADRLVDRLA